MSPDKVLEKRIHLAEVQSEEREGNKAFLLQDFWASRARQGARAKSSETMKVVSVVVASVGQWDFGLRCVEEPKEDFLLSTPRTGAVGDMLQLWSAGRKESPLWSVCKQRGTIKTSNREEFKTTIA
jgi:hypothetical protein